MYMLRKARAAKVEILDRYGLMLDKMKLIQSAQPKPVDPKTQIKALTVKPEVS